MNNNSTSMKSLTDWERLEKMDDEDIDLSECPEVTPAMFAKAVSKRGGIPLTNAKAQVTLRVDRDVLDWFKAKGQGQTQINALLRAYMEASK